MIDKPLVIGIDLGGTKISTALVDGDGKIIVQDYRQTMAAEGPDAVIARVLEAARRVRSIGVADQPVCASCELVGYCARCRGLAYMENGSISGPFSENCRIARTLKEVRDDREKENLY